MQFVKSLSRRALLTALAAGSMLGIGLPSLAQADPIELRYFYRTPWPSSERYANWLIDEWNKQHGERIHVTGTGVDSETYKTKQTLELASRNPPDIFYSWEGGRAAEVIKNGFAADVTPYYEQYGWEKFLVPASVSLATFNGRKYFVPTEIGASVVWYRKDLYEKLGLKVPTTWDELMANAKIAKDEGYWPFLLANQKKWTAQFMWSAIMVNKFGVEAYEGVVNNTIPWTDERAVATTQIMQDLAKAGMFEPSFNSIDVGPAMVPWSQGKALHWYQGSFNLGRFRGDKETCCVVPMDFFPLPSIDGRPAVMSVFAEDTIMIHAASPNKDAAAEFVNWMISKPAMSEKLVIDKPFPSSIEGDLSGLSEMEQRLGKTMAEAGSYTFMHVDHATSPAISDRFLDALQGVLAGAITPAQAMQQTEDEAVRARGKI